jgi:hypothetical protein
MAVLFGSRLAVGSKIKNTPVRGRFGAPKTLGGFFERLQGQENIFQNSKLRMIPFNNQCIILATRGKYET